MKLLLTLIVLASILLGQAVVAGNALSNVIKTNYSTNLMPLLEVGGTNG